MHNQCFDEKHLRILPEIVIIYLEKHCILHMPTNIMFYRLQNGKRMTTARNVNGHFSGT